LEPAIAVNAESRGWQPATRSKHQRWRRVHRISPRHRAWRRVHHARADATPCVAARG